MATYYWTGGSGNWNDNRWATISGGTPTGSTPQAGDNVVFDANSDTGSDFTITTPVSAPLARCLSITATGPDRRCTINAGNGLTVSGSVYGSSNFQVTGFVTLTPGSAQALDLQGQIFANITLSPTSSGAGYTLLSNISCGNVDLFTNSPTLNLNGYQMTATGFSVSTGTFTLDGTLVFNSTSGGTVPNILGFGASTSGTGTLRFTGNLTQASIRSAPGVTVEVVGSQAINFLNATNIAAFNASAASGALSFDNTLTVNGQLRMGAATGTMTNPVSLAGAAGPYDIQINGGLFNFSNTISISAGSYRLASALNISGGISLVSGTFNANSYSYTASFFSSNNSNVRTLTTGAGTWTLTGNNRTVWDLATTTNLTASITSPVIISNTSGTASFYGGGRTYPSLTITGNTPATTIYGSNTIGSFNTTTNSSTTVTFQSGSTSTFLQFLATGSSGRVLTLRSTTPGSQSTLAFNNGNVSSDYLNIQDSATSGTSLWYAGANSVNSGNNTGWIFAAGSTGSMLGLLWA